MRISTLCRDKFHFRIKDVYRIVLPFYIEHNPKKIKSIAKSTMLNCDVPRPIATHISKNISIAKSYNKSIGMLIDNSKYAARSFNEHHPPACSCHIIKKLGKNHGISLGHL